MTMSGFTAPRGAGLPHHDRCLPLWIARYETCYRGAIVRDDAAFCASCGEAIQRPTTGRLARFCSVACRNAAYRRRRQNLPEDAVRLRPGGRQTLIDRLEPLHPSR